MPGGGSRLVPAPAAAIAAAPASHLHACLPACNNRCGCTNRASACRRCPAPPELVNLLLQAVRLLVGGLVALGGRLKLLAQLGSLLLVAPPAGRQAGGGGWACEAGQTWGGVHWEGRLGTQTPKHPPGCAQAALPTSAAHPPTHLSSLSSSPAWMAPAAAATLAFSSTLDASSARLVASSASYSP